MHRTKSFTARERGCEVSCRDRQSTCPCLQECLQKMRHLQSHYHPSYTNQIHLVRSARRGEELYDEITSASVNILLVFLVPSRGCVARNCELPQREIHRRCVTDGRRALGTSDKQDIVLIDSTSRCKFIATSNNPQRLPRFNGDGCSTTFNCASITVVPSCGNFIHLVRSARRGEELYDEITSASVNILLVFLVPSRSCVTSYRKVGQGARTVSGGNGSERPRCHRSTLGIHVVPQITHNGGGLLVPCKQKETHSRPALRLNAAV